MKNKIYRTIVLLFFAIFLICFQSCKKNSNASNDTTSNTNINPKSKVTVYTNGNDPRLAKIETANQRLLFFGKRNADGSPSKLTGYFVYSLTDSTKFDFVTYDSLGRFSTLILRSGERMHVNYLLNDSMQITIGGKDSVIKQVTALRAVADIGALKIGRSLKIDLINRYTANDRNQSINGKDKNVNVKVTKLNTFNKIEDDVTDDEAAVLVNFYGGIYKNYSIQANYDPSRRVYSVALVSAGFEFDADNAYTRTLDFIKNSLDNLCNNYIQQLEDQVENVCELGNIPSPIQPVALILCQSFKAIIFLCKDNDVIDALSTAKDVTHKIDPNSIPISTDATVIVESNHTLYGRKNSAEMSVKQILTNPGDYDLKITYEYTKKIFPTVTTVAPSSITRTTAISGGNITNDGGASITAKGVCWSTSQNPTIANSKTTDGTGTGSFTSSMTNLTPNKKYFVRAYASNSAGTGYGNEVNFFTLQINAPTVTTSIVSSITRTTAISGGNITNDGGASITARGVVWSTSQNPTIANSKTTDGTGTGSFVSNITGLTANNIFYVRAYATNSSGTAYGSEVSLKTLGGISLIGTTYSLVSWRFQNVPGYINTATCNNPPYLGYVGNKLLKFNTANTYTITITREDGTTDSSGPYSYSIGDYYPDSLFLSVGVGADCTNSYGHQYSEGWGVKIPPGYDLRFGEYWPTRISLDGNKIYRAQTGDEVYIKQ